MRASHTRAAPQSETPTVASTRAQTHTALKAQREENTRITARPHTRNARQARAELRVGVLSGVAGFVDAAGFVSLAGFFPAHLTGELVSAGIALSGGKVIDGGGLRVALIPVFMLAVAGATIVARVTRRRLRRDPLPTLLALMAFNLSLFGWIGWLLARTLPQAGSAALWIQAAAAVSAVGVQGVFMREAHKDACPTTVMTGNLTQFLIELVEQVANRIGLGRQRAALDTAPEQRLPIVALALASFITCALFGGWLTLRHGPFSMSLPALAVALLAVWELRKRPA